MALLTKYQDVIFFTAQLSNTVIMREGARVFFVLTVWITCFSNFFYGSNQAGENILSPSQTHNKVLLGEGSDGRIKTTIAEP